MGDNQKTLTNGHLVVANWAGHGANAQDDARNPERGPQAIEFSANGKPLWIFRDPEKLNCIHHVLILDGQDLNQPYEEIAGRLVPMQTGRKADR